MRMLGEINSLVKLVSIRTTVWEVGDIELNAWS